MNKTLYEEMVQGDLNMLLEMVRFGQTENREFEELVNYVGTSFLQLYQAMKGE